ncbi:hypothetical protein QJS10_CPA07g01027 [Acorus calamus]|uniref:Uncharacterized protein n=1 Tax=Acorus calamus TaxID=4465 RepID=A0AAV9EH35_ACOCL|nr:hypothetical protein QJS10_CPA07g01027 [Acorus calamus]
MQWTLCPFVTKNSRPEPSSRQPALGSTLSSLSSVHPPIPPVEAPAGTSSFRPPRPSDFVSPELPRIPPTLEQSKTVRLPHPGLQKSFSYDLTPLEIRV